VSGDYFSKKLREIKGSHNLFDVEEVLSNCVPQDSRPLLNEEKIVPRNIQHISGRGSKRFGVELRTDYLRGTRPDLSEHLK